MGNERAPKERSVAGDRRTKPLSPAPPRALGPGDETMNRYGMSRLAAASYPGSTAPITVADGVCRASSPFSFGANPLQSHAPLPPPLTENELWREKIGEASTPVDRIGHVRVPLGLRLRRAPQADAPDDGIIGFDTRVYVARRTSHGWCYVTVLPQDTGGGSPELMLQSGFVEGRFVLLDPPDADSFLHWVASGETAADVAARYFEPPGGFTSGDDAYVFVSALWEVNKRAPETGEGGSTGGMAWNAASLSWDETLLRIGKTEESLRIYRSVRLRANHPIWIPGVAKVQSMRRAGTIATAAILSSGGEAGGFLRGLLDGLIDGCRDLAKDAEALARFLYDVLVDGKLFEKIKELAKEISKFISEFDLDRALETGKQALFMLADKWTAEDPYVRGHFQGKVMGYLAVLALPMLIPGGGAAKLAVRATRAAKTASTLGTVMDSSEAVARIARSLRAVEASEGAFLALEEGRLVRATGGLRKPASTILEADDILRLRQEFVELGGDPAILRFNKGKATSFLDDDGIINVRGDVFPLEDATHPRSAMSSKAALAHELGHEAHRGTKLRPGAWNDEFRASYWAAKNLKSLSLEERIQLVRDAIERAREAGVVIKPNAWMKQVIYGH